ncbi:MAG: GMC family oxidoreductase [Candidatus Portnoybacteria bacterium]|nr:GMC family oxidoreductase [Candidatus Portnoybacteria bacterium]
MKEKYDVLVVGSGAGGAPLAAELAKRGKKVLIIERGPVVKPDHLGNFWQTVIFNGYYHRLAAFSMSREMTTIYRTHNVGGTTVFACGNMVRSLQNEFLAYGIDLESSFQEAEQEIGVMPLAEEKIVTGTRAIMEASQRLGHKMVPMPKGFSFGGVCDLCGNCVLGCHQGAKWDARSYINRAIENGAILMPSTKVEKVLLTNGQVRGVEISGKKEIECGLVILAAGALSTPVILQKSGVSAGHRLFVDFFNATYGITDNLSQLSGASMGAVCTDFHKDQGFILSPYIDHWSQIMLFCPPWWNVIHRFPRSRIIGIMTKITDERIGRVEANGSISKKPTEQDHSRLEAGAALAKKILKEAGARSIITTKHSRGAHPGGTAAVGEVVDNELQVMGVDGLYVCDTSVFPDTPGLPPSLTDTALGIWSGQKLA